jgi:hypothetical protein
MEQDRLAAVAGEQVAGSAGVAARAAAAQVAVAVAG